MKKQIGPESCTQLFQTLKQPLFEESNSGIDKATIRKRALIFFSILGLGSSFQYVYGWALQHFGGYSYPYTSPLFLPGHRYSDFFNSPWWAMTGVQDIYAPFAVLISLLLSQIIDFSNGPHEAKHTISGMLCLGSMVACFLGSIAVLAWKILQQVTNEEGIVARITIFLLTFISMAISYPVIFTIDRGNFVAMTFAVLSLSLLFLNRPLLSSLFLGTALSLKYYLGLLLFPLYQSRRYRLLLYTIIFILSENIISALFLFLYGSSNIKLFSHLFDPAIYSLWTLSHKIAWSSHLLNLFFALIYPIHFVFGEDYARAAVPVIEKVYMYSIFLPGALLGPWLISKVVSDFMGRLFFVTVLTILISPNIGNYALAYLLLFVPYLLQIPERAGGTISTLLLALSLMPKNYVTLYLSTGDMRVTLQSFLNPLLLLALLAVPFLKQSFTEPSET